MPICNENGLQVIIWEECFEKLDDNMSEIEMDIQYEFELLTATLEQYGACDFYDHRDALKLQYHGQDFLDSPMIKILYKVFIIIAMIMMID
ncbi:transmembrane protein, putative (macronuclear) [Tetrahymena thermophila SB210]|uniref:Transmembrane protein, putative n=1 Tax=Tetrahymena thermophila (strain SB210) TaxID=312017 RepID=W7XEH3_TETTS|nr:transmembrane protein, putative [Tetrahymena thermophila SB210]EWS76097.1 transmembrane protein, putative [Tetrahymena thermophila SB210]|eukprot:XP_012651337.1 transmembrane protein, putative [Tetrahymena thermophila SB210]